MKVCSNTNINKQSFNESIMEEQIYLDTDVDLNRAITLDELQQRIKQDIHQWYKERDGNSSATRSTAISWEFEIILFEHEYFGFEETPQKYVDDFF